MKEATLIAGAGTHVVCPGCGARIGVLRKPLFQEHTFGLDAIEFAANQVRGVKQEAACLHCATPYAEFEVLLTGRTMHLHTDYGWLPPRRQHKPDRVEIIRPRG